MSGTPIDAVQGLGAQAEEFQLLGQALGAVVVLQHHVDRLAQRRQEGLLELVALAQAGTRQALHQAIEVSDQAAAQASAIGVDRLQRLADVARQLGVLRLFEALGEAQQAQVGLAEFRQVGRWTTRCVAGAAISQEFDVPDELPAGQNGA